MIATFFVDPSIENIHHQLIYRKSLRAEDGGSRIDAITTL
jgi:hypothetical protein